MICRLSILIVLFAASLSARASAHCDTTKGPVVTAARAALESGNPNLVLHWVRAEDEAAVRSVFAQTMQVRSLGPAAKDLADRYFFETVVRIHRAGEGAPYTGLTDEEPEPIILASDRALERGSAAEVEGMLVRAVKAGLAERFTRARAARQFAKGDIVAGRAFVAAYVPLTHWVEGVFTAADGETEHHAAVADYKTQGHRLLDEPKASPAPVAPTPPLVEGKAQLVPWILAALLGLAALVETVVLLRYMQRMRRDETLRAG